MVHLIVGSQKILAIHQVEGDDDKVACISKDRMANSEVFHGMGYSVIAQSDEKAVYKNRVGVSRRWRKEIFKAKPQIQSRVQTVSH